ncbi:T7SS effector LXG polymorphic toxin [Sporosarcina pasteurii]|uniref:Bacillus transposase protein n=1 Tax=Sporosarcina pasteurii TaxID=1474 RepID=A0A380BE13_SPOPA|nr:T7SS effector LXG polymorphic toxin [Sporosarcina pasteurii]MDS9472571.1 T7SS effector LXG polymorphic toxin [Sporosarcina pasteurii]QBQ06124.1 hypothetical protein E2C16_10770 [Sporosarcina pasteurii]SUI99382.1 Bacillus transposase protein [Sporosarcina pasteurii]
MPRLVNEELNDIVDKLSKYGEDVSTKLYEQYKNAVILSKTNHFRGKAGDAFKQYMNVSHINLSQKIINIAAELLEEAKKVQTEFLKYEQSGRGIVGSTTMEGVKNRINGKSGQFLAIDGNANQLLQQASQFIVTTKLSGDDVFHSFDEVVKNLNRRREELSEIDASVSSNLSNLITRVSHLQTQIFELSENFRDKNGIHYSQLNKIPEQPWYSTENNGAFASKAEADPFIHHAGAVRGDEGQWVFGTSDTNYATGTGYLAGASGQYTQDGEDVIAEGEAAMAKGSIEAQTFHELVRGQLSAEVLSAAGSIKRTSDGESAKGNVAYAKGDAKVMLGSENFHGYASAKGEVLTADGHTAFIVPLDPEAPIEVGAFGEASGATAKGQVGITLFGMEESGIQGESVKSPLGLDAEVSIGFQAGGGLLFQSETIYSTDYFYIRANELDVKLKLLAGLDLAVQLPTIHLKRPW